MNELPKFKCQKCGHEWIPRVPEVVMCPKCKTYKWNEPQKKEDAANVTT